MPLTARMIFQNALVLWIKRALYVLTLDSSIRPSVQDGAFNSRLAPQIRCNKIIATQQVLLAVAELLCLPMKTDIRNCCFRSLS